MRKEHLIMMLRRKLLYLNLIDPTLTLTLTVRMDVQLVNINPAYYSSFLHVIVD